MTSTATLSSPPPQVSINGEPIPPSPRTSINLPPTPTQSQSQIHPQPSPRTQARNIAHIPPASSRPLAKHSSAWGANFWTTLVDPQTGNHFFACPATGQVSWDPPAGTFVLPPSPDGEWWELSDPTRGGLPYYYHTRTGETVWERPTAIENGDAPFVIPLGIVQQTALGKRLSLIGIDENDPSPTKGAPPARHPTVRRTRSAANEQAQASPPRISTSTRASSSPGGSPSPTLRQVNSTARERNRLRANRLSPIPGSAASSDGDPMARLEEQYLDEDDDGFVTEMTTSPTSPTSPISKRSSSSTMSKSLRARSSASTVSSGTKPSPKTTPTKQQNGTGTVRRESISRARSHSCANRDNSLGAAVESLVQAAASDSGHGTGTIRSQKGGGVSWASSKGRGSHEREREQGRKSGGGGIAMPFSGKPNAYKPRSSTTDSGRKSAEKAEKRPSMQAQVRSSTLGPRPSQSSMRRQPQALSPTRGEFGALSPLRYANGLGDETAGPERSASTPPGAGGMRGGGTISGKSISAPVFDKEATLKMSPLKNRAPGKPIPIPPVPSSYSPPRNMTGSTQSLSSSTRGHSNGHHGAAPHPSLPVELVTDIQKFADSDFARRYFKTHHTGFIFRRRVPVEEMMTWQKHALSSGLLEHQRKLSTDAIRIFKVIQLIMGDRDRGTSHPTSSTGSLQASSIVEEERWLITQGLTHGELRDEIYCQVMKQLNGNPTPESVFRGWQLLCVLLVSFPPSKDFEDPLRAFLTSHTAQKEARADLMAKHCLRRLAAIVRKGPRGKPLSTAEIAAAADAAFAQCTFGESLEGSMQLQAESYPDERVPVVLPFLANGILLLGGTRAEGIFRVPGDNDTVAGLRLRLDTGRYTVEGVDDPHVLASLLKLWLRELLDPLVPAEMYNECITAAMPASKAAAAPGPTVLPAVLATSSAAAVAADPRACVDIVRRLPDVNRRVLLFVVSFLQMFLEEKVCRVTKMTSANLALVMAPNLLRCPSENMAVVFVNAQYEQIFVHTLLLHLKCDEIDPDYVPTHGLDAPEPLRRR
ncbi:RhoGAP-domain-containing protein [Coniophora puteana RWD-64-598 SS2]|uniref:RhoGAP-domain-containing protein n=1 Tax=Coniophora puteana (strain RWD-64-598) TaxID=741705 RepID=A0A5M3MU65_CONPW|nr:RhoGAP-domain-containing protein [Coniophora puteana RWD-64-598 SS2]EIW82547.1 RhoGAP-domain-containing protein [Coniophora puteana RWD-64-598 SS2]